MKGYGCSNIGLTRKQNQDAFRLYPDSGVEIIAAVLCDGMGGVIGGEVASNLAADSFLERFTQTVSEEGPCDLSLSMRESVAYANLKVYDRAVSEPELNGMGTTLVAVAFSGTDMTVVNIGDSRCYLLTSDHIQQITRDHSHVQDLVDSGLITADEARSHPKKNLITRAVGIQRKVVCDLYKLDVGPGDIVLLCSDGLSGLLTDDEILQFLLWEPEPEKCAQALVRAALNRGAPDNVTVVVINC